MQTKVSSILQVKRLILTNGKILSQFIANGFYSTSALYNPPMKGGHDFSESEDIAFLITGVIFVSPLSTSPISGGFDNNDKIVRIYKFLVRIPN